MTTNRLLRGSALVAVVAVATLWGLAGPSVAADFDGDGYDDLPIPSSHENIGSAADAGAVHVLYGSAGGTRWQGNQLWHQNVYGVPGFAADGAGFGATRAAGDFDADGRDDLAIGVPGQAVGGDPGAGAVQVFYGEPGGLRANSQLWTQDGSGILNAAEPYEGFGSSLATGDFDGDGYDDLAVGIPAEKVGAFGFAGAVHVIYGGPGGLTELHDQFWSQDSPGVLNACETGDAFGYFLAAGDFDADDRDDLAVGVNGEDVGSVQDAGLVQVLYGSPSGLSADGDQEWHQNTAGVPGFNHPDDRFGVGLATGDFDGDGRSDLATGTLNEDVGGDDAAGVVTVLFGAAGGIAASGAQQWSQDSPGVLNASEPGEFWGRTLAAGDFDGDGRDDIAVGVSAEKLYSFLDTGAVQVIYGTAAGLAASGNQLWSLGDVGAFEAEAAFGSTLWPADFDGDGRDDLGIGVPGADVDAVAEAGMEVVLAGSAGGLAATGAEAFSENSPYIHGTSETGDYLGI